MTDERLAEIEAYCGIDGPWVRVVDGCTFTFHDPPRDIVNQRWLLSRVRALEAQAERDGAIIDIVGGLVAPFAWTDAMDGDGEYSFSFGEMMVKAVEDGRALALENALAKRDAALKAQEGE